MIPARSSPRSRSHAHALPRRTARRPRHRANGFIASHVIERLLAAGHHVTGKVRDPAREAKTAHLLAMDGAPERPALVAADLTDPDPFLAHMDVDVVMHMASPHAVDVADPQRDLVDPAVRGTRSALDAAARSPRVRRVVLTSSMAAITDEPDGRVLTEADWNEGSSLDRNPNYYSKTLAERRRVSSWRGRPTSTSPSSTRSSSWDRRTRSDQRLEPDPRRYTERRLPGGDGSGLGVRGRARRGRGACGRDGPVRAAGPLYRRLGHHDHGRARRPDARRRLRGRQAAAPVPGERLRQRGDEAGELRPAQGRGIVPGAWDRTFEPISGAIRASTTRERARCWASISARPPTACATRSPTSPAGATRHSRAGRPHDAWRVEAARRNPRRSGRRPARRDRPAFRRHFGGISAAAARSIAMTAVAPGTMTESRDDQNSLAVGTKS